MTATTTECHPELVEGRHGHGFVIASTLQHPINYFAFASSACLKAFALFAYLSSRTMRELFAQQTHPPFPTILTILIKIPDICTNFCCMPATFQDNDITSGLKDKRKLSAYLDSLVHKHLEGIKKIKLNYIFCSDDYLLQINKQFLNHDTYTDIITFDLSETEHNLTGEIYVSADRVKENAVKFGVSYQNELHRVIFHGTLHLCGFGDKKPADKQEMRKQEDACLATYLDAATT